MQLCIFCSFPPRMFRGHIPKNDLSKLPSHIWQAPLYKLIVLSEIHWEPSCVHVVNNFQTRWASLSFVKYRFHAHLHSNLKTPTGLVCTAYLKRQWKSGTITSQIGYMCREVTLRKWKVSAKFSICTANYTLLLLKIPLRSVSFMPFMRKRAYTGPQKIGIRF